MEAEKRDTTDTVVEHAPEVWDDQAPAAGPPARGVFGRLFRDGYYFDFYQAVRLLEKYFRDAPPPGETSDYSQEQIYFRPDVALSFPSTDVRRVEWKDNRRTYAQLTLTFMGLYGIGSPLPVYFYDELATEEPPTFPLRKFLDIFNHRLYAYFYRAWKKYRPQAHLRAQDDVVHAQRFLALSGVGTPGALERSPIPHHMLLASYAGRLSPRVRNGEGLQRLLFGLLDVPVEIVENVPRWVPIPERASMGRGKGLGMLLGLTTTVGQRVLDVSGKFRVALGPLSFEAYKNYLPGEPLARRLAYLVRLYVPDYLDYDVELHLDTSGIPPVRLGGGEVRLGLTTWLGKPKDEVTVHHVTY